MFNKQIGMIIVIFSMLYIISCSKDDNPVTPNENKKAKELGLKEITVPEALVQSNDSHAQMCVGFINMANGFKGFSSLYQPPVGINLAKIVDIKDDWTRTWTDEQLSITMNYYENDVSFGWQVFLTGTDNQYTYSNWLLMEAEQKVDDSYGTLIIYKPVTEQVEFKWTWSQSQSGKNTFTMEIFGDDGLPETKIDAVSNSDESGELIFYKYVDGSYVKESRTTWTATGTGHWEEYDASGNIINQGDF